MAATKKATKTTTHTEDQMKEISQTKFDEGRESGQQEIYKAITNFLLQRMHSHFELKQDDLAREMREIYIAIKQNIK